MSNFSIYKASKIWGISRTTIYKKIELWELSQNQDKTISMVEMIRIFGEAKPPKTVQNKKEVNKSKQLWTDEIINLKLELERQKNTQWTTFTTTEQLHTACTVPRKRLNKEPRQCNRTNKNAHFGSP